MSFGVNRLTAETYVLVLYVALTAKEVSPLDTASHANSRGSKLDGLQGGAGSRYLRWESSPLKLRSHTAGRPMSSSQPTMPVI